MPKIRSIPTPEEEKVTLIEQQLSGAQGEIKDLRDSLKRARANLEEWQERFEALLALKQPLKVPPLVPTARGRAASGGVAVAVWSDWHVAERIDAAKVRGLNEFNPEIAERRAAHCAMSTLRLFRHVRKSYSVDSMLLFLGGDFITGYLHEELAQTNYMGPVEEGRFAEKLLISSIRHLAEEKGLRRLHIVAQRGNHGRTTRKMQFKNDFETSYETWVYAHLADVFAGDPRIVMEVPKADVHCVPVLKDWLVRCYHGHQVRYSDGVGGVTIPLNKWQAKQNATERAAFNLMGHYHHYSEPNTVTTMNGSLKGYDEYAASGGMPFQPPLQSFLLLDVERRMVAQRMPVFCA